MNKTLLCIPIMALLCSCATIIGGSNYNAMVEVNGSPNAEILYKGRSIGTGRASVSIPRKEANKVVFTVDGRNCPSKDFIFSTRVFRGWALVGSLFLSPTINGVPIPIPVVIDLAVGSYYKPNHTHPAIFKEDFKNFRYSLDYKCDSKENTIQVKEEEEQKQEQRKLGLTKEEKLIELKELFDNGMITEEEHKKARQEILSK